MPPEHSLDALVAPLREDVVSGASALAVRAAEIVRRAARDLPAESVDELRDTLTALGRSVLAAQPAMAPLVTLVREMLLGVEAADRGVPAAGVEAADRGEPALGAETADRLASARDAAAAVAGGFARRVEAAGPAIARHAQALLPDGARVATISSSGSVRAALELAAETRTLEVVCFESRPLSEGRRLAASLADAGLSVELAVDAAIHALAPGCDIVLIGADSIGDAGAVNKIGSVGLTAAARQGGVDVYVLTDTTKLLPRGWPKHLDDDRPAREVWDALPAGVRVWNRYFEAVPLEWLRGVVTERGILGSDALQELRSGLVTPRALREP